MKGVEVCERGNRIRKRKEKDASLGKEANSSIYLMV